MDSPAVAVTDASVIAPLADASSWWPGGPDVPQSGGHRRNLLKSANVRFLGAVLTVVSRERGRYGYGCGDHNRYYGDSEDEDNKA